MLFFSDTLFLHWKTPRHEVSCMISRWLSGTRDRHAGPEGPPRKKNHQQETTAGPAAANVSERPSGLFVCLFVCALGFYGASTAKVILRP